MKEELTVADSLHSIKIGALFGFVAGAAIGVALLLYLDAEPLNRWPGVVSIPLLNGLGWALYGVIAGCGGLFSNVLRKTEQKERESVTLKPAA